MHTHIHSYIHTYTCIKAVPAVTVTRPKPPTAAIGGWLPRKAERGFEFLKSLAAVLLSLLLILSPTPSATTTRGRSGGYTKPSLLKRRTRLLALRNRTPG